MQVRVRVTAGAKKEGIEALPNNRFKIAVKQKPEQGAANKRVIELVAAHFRVAPKKVRIIRGHKTPFKIMVVNEGKIWYNILINTPLNKKYYVEILQPGTGKVLWHYFAEGSSKDSVSEAASHKFMTEYEDGLFLEVGGFFITTIEEEM